ncbi:hypothetical protein HQ584_12685 [Patescibacteria group bacterium]|nr:hypothetical protein [Patescibacteria group bacterium]
MIDAKSLKPYRKAAEDYEKTEEIKNYIQSLKDTRDPFYLNSEEFDRILRWKLRQQYERQKKIRSKNTDDLIRAVTSIALTISHDDEDYKLDLRFKLLMVLRGVGVPVASAILALCFPEKYAVIDFRGWRQFFGEDKRYFSIKDYKKYMKEIKRLANELGWLPQEVDLAIWEYDRGD